MADYDRLKEEPTIYRAVNKSRKRLRNEEDDLDRNESLLAAIRYRK